MLEQRHKMALLQLEKEMQAEMQKQRELLNRELEEELQAELMVGITLCVTYNNIKSLFQAHYMAHKMYVHSSKLHSKNVHRGYDTSKIYNTDLRSFLNREQNTHCRYI